jgi:hypothetical protein
MFKAEQDYEIQKSIEVEQMNEKMSALNK